MAGNDWLGGLRDGLREHERHRVPDIGRYTLREPLGEGTSAVVYRAWDPELRREVALKLLRPSVQLSSLARERFRREAESMAGLAHPNVVSVFDAGEQDGRPYLVLELVQGQPLSASLSPASLPLFEKIARGVGAAHRKGIVHRDLKPGNILLTAEGEPKVADFGLAHAASEAELTRTGAILGTPLYMAPEQVEGRPKDVSPATDVYALGAMLYEAATGRPPHVGETPIEIYARITRDDPVPPRRLNPALPPELEAIVLKALEKEPGRRYPDALALAEDLRRAREGEPVRARPPAAWRPWARKAARHRAALAALALASVLAALWARGAAARAQAAERAYLLRLPEIQDPRGGVTLGGGPAVAGKRLLAGDLLETEAGGSVALAYPDQARIDLAGGAALRQGDDARAPRLEKGRALVKSSPDPASPILLSTPFGGFELRRGVWLAEATDVAATLEVRAGSADGAARAVAGERVTLARGRPPLVEPIGEGPLGDFRRRDGRDAALIGWWKIDEAEGVVLKDASGKGRDARLLGPVAWISDQGRPAVRIDGRGGAIELPGGADFDLAQAGSYALSIWARPDAAPQEAGVEFNGAYPLLMKSGWREGLAYSGDHAFLMYHWTKPARWATTFSETKDAPGPWRHVAGVVDRATRRTEIYVDGELRGANDWPDDAPGEDMSGLRWRAGTLDPPLATHVSAKAAFRSARVYARALSPAEVRVLCEIDR